MYETKTRANHYLHGNMTELALWVIWWLVLATVLSVTFCVGTVTAFYWWHGNLTISKCCRNIPTYKLIPIVTYWQGLKMMYKRKYPRAFLLQLMAFLCKMYQREGIAMIWVGFRPIVFLFKAEMVETLLNNSITITKSAEYDFLKSWLGTGLLTSTGQKWRSHRKLLTPSFHFKILEHFIPVFDDEATILAKKLEKTVGKPWIDIVPYITLCTLDAICKTAMGVDLNTQSGCCKEYLEGIQEVSDFFIYRVLRPWLWIDPVFLYLFPSGWKYRRNLKHIQDFTKKVIKEKKEYMIRQRKEGKSEETVKSKRKAFLELLLEHHLKDETFTEENIREEVDTFMFEGHDTTAMALSWTLYELGRHPEIQEKVFQELEVIFGSDRERPVTSEDLKEMKYLECVIKETLRLFPSVAFIARQLKENLKFNEDYTLTPGCTCFVAIFMLHKDPEQFPEPEVFNPDRFSPENNKKRHPYAYIPFSAGPRNCIGQRFALMEQKTILAHVLRKFKVTSLDPPDKIETMAGLILKNTEPIRINFEIRRSPNDEVIE